MLKKARDAAREQSQEASTKQGFTFKERKDSGLKDVVVFDAPQLFEAKCDLYCDVIVSVIADDDLRLKRIKARDNITKEEIFSRFKAQYSKEFFIKKSDYIIENNSSFEKLKEKTLELFGKVI